MKRNFLKSGFSVAAILGSAMVLMQSASATAESAPAKPADAPTNPLGTSGSTSGAGTRSETTTTPPPTNGASATGAGTALPLVIAEPGSPEELAQLRALVNVLSTRLQALESEQKKTAEAVAKPQVSSGSKLPVTISGLLQVHGLGAINEDENGPDARFNDTFRLRRGELRVVGRITPRITGTAMFDIAKTQDSNDRPSDEVLQEIFIAYLLNENKERGTAHYIDAGQFKIPVGYEGDLVSSSALQTVERALMYQTRDPFRGGYGDKRETGVQLRGTMGQIAYWIGVFNGLGERQSALATRDNKAVVARLIFRPRRVEGLQLGVSGGIGNTGNASSTDPRLDRNLLNAFLAFKRGKVTAQAEYLTADAQLIDETSVRDVRSYYGSLGYLFTKRLEGVVRYDVFDFDRRGDGGKISEATLGLNYYIKGNNAKIQANIVRRNGDATAISGFRNDRTEVRTNLQVAF